MRPGDPKMGVRGCAASNPSCASGTLDRRSRDGDGYVRLCAARNQNASMPALARLLTDKDPEVLAVAAVAVAERLSSSTTV